MLQIKTIREQKFCDIKINGNGKLILRAAWFVKEEKDLGTLGAPTNTRSTSNPTRFWANL